MRLSLRSFASLLNEHYMFNNSQQYNVTIRTYELFFAAATYCGHSAPGLIITRRYADSDSRIRYSRAEHVSAS